MALSLGNITFDCDDPRNVAAFWSEVLGLPVNDGASEFFASIGSTGAPAGWLFLKVPEPKSAKNRVHLDLLADDPEAEIERLVGLGATHVADKDEWGFQWSVLADVEGNEFCVAAHPPAGE